MPRAGRGRDGPCASPTPATCGSRTPSSTAWTSSGTPTPTATAGVTSQGLSRKVDYLADLGVTCIWLMPFYPSPLQDDGYDISDFYDVDPRLGTLGDVVDFLRTAHDRGIRVIADLVPNHTSVRAPVVPVRPQGPRLAVPRLVRLVRRPADGRARRRRVPRRGDEHLAVRRGVRPLLPAPVLPVPAGPRRVEPRGARRARPGSPASGPSWASTGSGWTPSRRCCRPTTTRRRRGCPTRTSSCATCARSSAAAGRDVPARRGEPAARPAARRSSATAARRSSPARSTSSRWPTCGCRWPAATPARWRTPSSRGRRSRRSASGRPSCATTTS